MSDLNQRRRVPIQVVCLFVCACLTVSSQAETNAADPSQSAPRTAARPNVVLIVADDLNNDLGCYGHQIVESPHIDRLAARGIRFDRAYCQAPVCNASRASFFSGLLPETIGVLDNSDKWPGRLEQSQYIQECFRSQGYYTASIGKVLDHTRVPTQSGWDVEIREWGKYPPDALVEKEVRFGDEASRYWATLAVPDEETPDGEAARNAAALLDLMETSGRKPFFLTVGFRRPHAPFVAPARYFERYRLESIALPRYPQGHLESILPAARSAPPAAFEESADSLRAYYACISFVDAQVGVLLEALDRLKLWNETVVIFVSDHGYHTGQHGMWRKGTLFEESARVPLIIAAPGQAAGVSCPRVVEMLDVYPTLVELCGLETPGRLEGQNIAPLLHDPGQPWEHAAATICNRRMPDRPDKIIGRSVRTERFRFTEWDDGRLGTELYDHADDPGEFVNLAGQPEYAERADTLRKLLDSRLDAHRRR